MSSEDLEDLISRTALRDRAAFASLYDVTAGKLHAVTLRVLGDRAAAEDAVQEAYIKIWRNADRYAVTGHSPMTWLITIARNTAIDKLRARRPTSDIADHAETLAAGGPTPEQSAAARSEAARVTACLDELEPAKRAAVRAAYLEGRSYAQLAEIHGVPLNTIRTWLRRSLMRLRECLSR